MKKISLLFVLLSISVSCIFYGCNNSTPLYFYFNFDEISMEVGNSISLYDLDVNSNVDNYEQMHIHTSDNKFVKIDGNNIVLLKEGSVKINVSGVINNTYIGDSFYLYIFSNNGLTSIQEDNKKENELDENTDDISSLDNNQKDETENQGENSSNNDKNKIEQENINIVDEKFSIKDFTSEIDDDYKIFSFDVFFNNEETCKYKISVLNGNNDVFEYYKFDCTVEFICKKECNILIKIYNDNNYFFVNLF